MKIEVEPETFKTSHKERSKGVASCSQFKINDDFEQKCRKTFVNDPLHPQYFDYFCSVAPIQTRVSNFSTMDDGAVKAQVLILF